MRKTLKIWAESKLGQDLVWGKNDCSLLAIEFLTLLTQRPVPPMLKSIYGMYKNVDEAQKVFPDITVDAILEYFGYEEVDDKPKGEDLLRLKHSEYNFDSWIPVLYGQTGMILNEGKIKQCQLSAIENDYRVYRRKQ